MATSPSNKNYSIPTGVGSFKQTGDADFRPLGNVVNFSISNTVTKKDHFRSYGGRRTKDKTTVTQVAATAKGELDELTAENIAIFALGDVTTDTSGAIVIHGLSNTTFSGTLKIVGDNEEGTQIDWVGDVIFTPSGDFSLIQDSDDYTKIAFEADVQEDANGQFGTWTIREQA
jgi:hypothetical protein